MTVISENPLNRAHKPQATTVAINVPMTTTASKKLPWANTKIGASAGMGLSLERVKWNRSHHTWATWVQQKKPRRERRGFLLDIHGGSSHGVTRLRLLSKLRTPAAELALQAGDDAAVHLADAAFAQVERGADFFHRQLFVVIQNDD